ncbi:hypothetical protein TNCV_3841661 [Trichonephila clavipes]|nr:hypothetical protein TNCV_3841661 [Trichonephila clavipes]
MENRSTHTRVLHKLREPAAKTFKIPTEAYRDECHVHLCLNGISGFQGERTVWKMMNMLGAQVKSYEKGTRFTRVGKGSDENGDSPEGPSKNLIPELLPALTAPIVEVCEC